MSDQGSVYVDFIAAELRREYERRDKIDTRAAGTVTGAAGLITISLATLAIIEGKDFTVHGIVAVCVVVTLIAFLVSAALAILAAFNWPYYVTTSKTMAGMLSSPHWQDSEVTARNFTSQINSRTLFSLRAGNNRKADLFLAALVCQVVAVAGVAVTILTIVFW